MKKLVSINPANYEVLGRVQISTENEIRRKVKKAKKALEKWQILGIEGRVKLLNKAYKEMSKKKLELAILETKEMGMPISQSIADIEFGLNYLIWYLKNAEKFLAPETTYENKNSVYKVYHEPIGIAAVISPWNFPFSNFIWGVGQNLLVGNIVLFKHSEECPLFGKKIENILDSCNLPAGVFNEMYGDGKVGDFLVRQDINLICFTGSTVVGKYLYKVAAEKFIKVCLELGGSSPGIIFEDADLDNILETVYSNRFSNCGQVCDSLKRLIVHKSRFNETVKKLKNLVGSKKVGNPEDKSTDIGPLVSKKQLELLISQVKDAAEKGAKVITGGKSPEKLTGAYYLPTLLTSIKRDMRVWQEEVFGPVLPIISFKTEDEAVKLANDTKYGLSSYIFTKDKKKAKRVASKIKAGMVNINNASGVLPCNPFGGYKESGIGRENGKCGFYELFQIKVVAEDRL